MKKNINDRDNELTLSEFSGTCFRCVNKGHKDNKYKELYSSK